MTDMRDVFDARAYLRQYFVEPDEADRATLRFWVRHIGDLPAGARILEYGGGPALYSVLALARKAAAIHFTDYVPAALREVRQWAVQSADAHDWTPYTRLTLELEGAPADDEAIAARHDALRRQLIWIGECDARTEAMLPDAHPPYDAITAHHCLDVAARDAADFERMVRRLCDMLSPGGLFLLSVSTGATVYTIDATRFDCLDLGVDDVRRTLADAGIDPHRVSHLELPVEGEEYTHMLLFAGWKR